MDDPTDRSADHEEEPTSDEGGDSDPTANEGFAPPDDSDPPA